MNFSDSGRYPGDTVDMSIRNGRQPGDTVDKAMVSGRYPGDTVDKAAGFVAVLIVVGTPSGSLDMPDTLSAPELDTTQTSLARTALTKLVGVFKH